MAVGWSKFIEFFVRLALKFVQRIGTRDWPAFDAIVASSKLEECFTGCLLVVIHYKYRNAGKRIEGTYKQPFIYRNYAEAYLRRYPAGSELPVIVSPKHPSYSIPPEGKITFTQVKPL